MAITTFRIKVGEQWHTVHLGDLGNSPAEVTVDEEVFYVEVELVQPKPSAQSTRGRGAGAEFIGRRPQGRVTAPSSEKILRSPMPGRVLSIRVRPGDRVSAGDEVCVVEAMKMEQSVRVSREAVIKAVHVQPMDSVKANDPLIELE